MTTQKPHTLHTLHTALQNDLSLCHTEHERIMVTTIGGKEIRELAQQLATRRRLTPQERLIANNYGYQP